MKNTIKSTILALLSGTILATGAANAQPSSISKIEAVQGAYDVSALERQEDVLLSNAYDTAIARLSELNSGSAEPIRRTRQDLEGNLNFRQPSQYDPNFDVIYTNKSDLINAIEGDESNYLPNLPFNNSTQSSMAQPVPMDYVVRASMLEASTHRIAHKLRTSGHATEPFFISDLLDDVFSDQEIPDDNSSYDTESEAYGRVMSWKMLIDENQSDNEIAARMAIDGITGYLSLTNSHYGMNTAIDDLDLAHFGFSQQQMTYARRKMTENQGISVTDTNMYDVSMGIDVINLLQDSDKLLDGLY